MKIKAAVVSYGNIGRAVLASLAKAPDFEIAGVVRREGSPPVEGIKTVSRIEQLGKPDVAILCGPSRSVGETAAELASSGINTVDSFDIHSLIWDYVQKQDAINRASGSVSVVSAGWDPGTDSVIRALLEAMAPTGDTYTNFGPGMSMGHSVAAAAVKGVKKALSITVPEGKGIHSRRVYIELEKNAGFNETAAAIKSDPYFSHDNTTVELAESVDALKKTTHGVLLERTGTSADYPGQKFSFDMKIDNPSLTGQIMVSCARAASRLTPGCYTLPEIPPMYFLSGSREDLIKRLV